MWPSSRTVGITHTGNSWVVCSVLVLTFLDAISDILVAFFGGTSIFLCPHTPAQVAPGIGTNPGTKGNRLGLNIVNKNPK